MPVNAIGPGQPPLSESDRRGFRPNTEPPETAPVSSAHCPRARARAWNILYHPSPPPHERLPSRNEVLGFAERTRRNLDFIIDTHERGERGVHVVTQAVLSLLGVVIFPYEQYFKWMNLNHTLSELEAMGWPRWDQSGWTADNLQHLLRRIRNATAHSNISFSSESDQPADVQVVFECSFDDGQTWRGVIPSDHLIAFCQHFLTYVEDYVG